LLDRENPLLEKEGTNKGVSSEMPVLCVSLLVLHSIEFLSITARFASSAWFGSASLTAISQFDGNADILGVLPDFSLSHFGKRSRRFDPTVGVAVEQGLERDNERTGAIVIRRAGMNANCYQTIVQIALHEGGEH
jgi:hypothetical protein